MDLLPYIEKLTSPPYIHLIIIFSFYIVTWYKSLYGDPVIDDDLGIFAFSQRYDVKEDKVIDTYKEGDKEYKFLNYLPHLGFPGAFMRWHRLHLGKKFSVIGKNKKGHEIYGWVQSAFRHHVWSLSLYGICLVLAYNFLAYHFGSNIAFGATLLFAVHPIISQSIAWISGVNYLYCLLFLLSNYNILQLGLSYYWTIPLTILFTALSSLSLLVGCFNFATLWILGFYWEALAALIIGIAIMLRDGSVVVGYRRGEFRKQGMTESITPNLRKPIVMLKTLWYYLCIIIFPKSLGLYHEFGYHYSRKDEEPSFMFWMGLLSLIVIGVSFYYGNPMIRFCIVWFFSYFLVFSNLITANQFVVERYVFIPSLAYCVIFSSLIYPFKEIFWLLIGLYTMRSILHVWTFNNQITFYLSNILNFPKSEVAFGNLGVSLQNTGKSGAAMDLWMEATRINPLYDVPWYNMHSLVKGAGQLELAKEYLNKCMDAKVVHFKDVWDKEAKELDQALLKKKCYESLSKEVNELIKRGDYEKVKELRDQMEALTKPGAVVEMVKAPT